MNKFDKAIRDNLIAQAPKMPDNTSRHFDETLSNLVLLSQENNSKETSKISFSAKKRPEFRPVRVCAAVCCAIAAVCVSIIVLANINQNIAYAMQDIPFIGNIIRVVTVYKKNFNDDYHYADINVPHVENETGLEEQIDYINADIRKLTDTVIAAFEEDVAELPDSHFGLTIDYETVTNTDNWFTLKLILHYAAGSSSTEYRFYHIDKKAGKIVTLPDLFDNNYDYVTDISAEIIRQMNEQMDADSSVVYWIKREGSESFYEFEKIDKEQNFYFTEDGSLVIVFQKYEVAPGSMGIREFKIPKSLYEKYLK